MSSHSNVAEIIVERKDGSTPLGAMIKDPYANYVVQRVLSMSTRTVSLFAEW